MIKAKRFWEEVSFQEVENGFGVKLDARDLLTPLKSKLIVPTQALAKEIANEWRAVEGEINPEELPMTKRANSAIERIAHQRSEVMDHLLDYVDSDLVCYRAETPKELVTLQSAWDEWIEWARSFDIFLARTTGLMPVAQPAGNRVAAEKWFDRWSDFEFTAIYDFISLNGSFVLGMALAENAVSIEDCFRLSVLDEEYQESVWGEDEDAVKMRQYKLNDLLASFRFYELVKR